MFTVNIYLRFALIILLLGGGIFLAFLYGFWYAFPFLLIGIFFLLGYIFLGTVQSAAQFVQEMKFEEAEKRLGLTFNYKWLYKTNRAFFCMIKGTLAMQNKKNDEAEEWLERAQSIDLPSDNEKAMVLLQLANIHATKGKWNNAIIHFRNAKKLKVTEPQLKLQLKQFEKALTNRGQLKHQHSTRGGRSGGRIKRI